MTKRNNSRVYQRKDLVFASAVVCIVLLKRLLISPYGINREAAIEMEAIFSVLDGKLIYRDFFWYHGFLPVYWHALIFKLFSPEMYYLRLFVTGFAALASWFAYKSARFFLSPAKAGMASVLAFSGLLIPEHVTGTMMAFCGATASLYYLLDYCDTAKSRSIKSRSMFLAGLSGGISVLAQVLPIGLGCLAAGIITIACYGIFDDKKHWKALKTFLWGYIPLPLAGYGVLGIFVSAKTMFVDLFPIFTGYEASPRAMASFPIPSLWPEGGWDENFTQWIATLNQYLFVNFRWWLIVLVFTVGLTVFMACWKNKTFSVKNLLLLGTITLFGPVFETKFLFYLGRLGIVPNYINMLPTFILLFYLIDRLAGLRRFTTLAGVGLLILYFVYPLEKYYAYFSRNAVALDMPYADGISVSPYKHDLYQKTVDYIQSHTGREDKIVFAGVNRYYSIFSGRKDVFRSNILTFAQTSFYPSRKTTGWLDQSYSLERKIVQKVEQEKPGLVLMPEDFQKYGNPVASPFLSYLAKRWRVVKRTGSDSLKNAYEYESPVLIYKRKVKSNMD